MLMTYWPSPPLSSSLITSLSNFFFFFSYFVSVVIPSCAAWGNAETKKDFFFCFLTSPKSRAWNESGGRPDVMQMDCFCCRPQQPGWIWMGRLSSAHEPIDWLTDVKGKERKEKRCNWDRRCENGQVAWRHGVVAAKYFSPHVGSI